MEIKFVKWFLGFDLLLYAVQWDVKSSKPQVREVFVSDFLLLKQVPRRIYYNFKCFQSKTLTDLFKQEQE